MRTRYRTPTTTGGAASRNADVNSRNLYQRIPSSTDATRGRTTLDSTRLNQRYRSQLSAPAARSSRATPVGTTPSRTTPGRTATGLEANNRARATTSLRTSASAAREVRGTASNRYATPGTAGTAARTPTLVNRTARGANGSRAAILASGTAARAGTTTLTRAGAPLLTNNLRVDAVSAANFGVVPSAALSFGFGVGFNGGGWWGGGGWGGGWGYPAWCSPWGFYGYPFAFGSYWPWYRARWWWRGPFWGGTPWHWPTSVYSPIYVQSYNPYPSTIVVAEEPVTEAPAEEVVAAGEDPAESLAALADRFVGLGDFYFREGRFAEAAEAYARARTYAPDDATIHFVLSDALFAVGDYHFAAFLIAEALRLEPDLAKADADKRTFYSDPTVFDEQMDTLARYLADKPYDAAAHLVNGYNLRFSGRSEEAKQAFRRVLEIEAGNQAAKTFLDAMDGLEPPGLEPRKE